MRRQFLRQAASLALTPLFGRAALAAGDDPNRVVVLDSADASITLVDQSTRRVLQTFAAGKEPHHLMVTPDNKLLIVADAISGNLLFLDPVSGQPEGWLAGIEDPYQIGFSPNRSWFVANCLRLNRVDLYRYGGGRALQLVKRMPLEAIPSHMAFTADSQIVFVSLQQTGEVAAIHLPTQSLLWTMKVGDTPAGVWLTPQDRVLLVGLTGSNAVVAVDWRRRQVVARIVTGEAAHNFRSCADGRHVFVSNRISDTISILDMQALRKVGDITGLRPGPDDMELSADRRWLWTTFRFDRTVGVIDLQSLKLADVIGVGKSPHGIYFRDRAPFYDNLPPLSPPVTAPLAT
ncbi:beta-propeller fold lactonase family protein [Thiomonas sp.]|jgi:DNA-binding beta-propeller fold protein YncE|uniref:YncE family protein n=1 Tax=Thiomonas sp. TaxID=2047785 RepID=UPI00261A354C|nr:beta-propeller fold lactonase family protein [Thiomonas sp.]